MNDAFDASKEDFDGWVDKWDKALKSGVFNDAPKIPSTAPHTSQDSFFGLQQTNPTDSIRSSDADYWRAISSVADGGVEMQRIDESDAVSVDLPNPVRKSTEGTDQDLKPAPLGLTFSEEDVRKLEEMKIKLHELENKIAAMEDKGDYESQVKAMIDKIGELSDKMCRPKK
jgi:hypothetical protein